VLLAEDWEQGRDGHELGRANNLIGVWTETHTINGRKALITFNQGGTASFDLQGDSVFDVVQSPAHGLWKKIGPRTFISTFLVLEYNRDPGGSLNATAKLQAVYTLSPSGDQYDQKTFITETLADGTVLPVVGPLDSQGVRLTLEPR